MAKKFGKFLLFTAAVGATAAAAYYFVRKKDSDLSIFQDEDEDYDDFSDEFGDDTDTSTRSYVSLTRDGQDTSEDIAAPADYEDAATFTPLTEQLEQDVEDKLDETIEEFFDEEDSSEEEPPISDN